MKRGIKLTRTIIAEDDSLRVYTHVTVESKPSTHSRDEVRRTLDRIADGTMAAIKDAPYISVPLSRMKVSS